MVTQHGQTYSYTRKAPAGLRQSTACKAYHHSDWHLTIHWLRDRIKYLMLLKQYSYDTLTKDNYAMLDELDDLGKTFTDIYNDVWEELFNELY